MKKLIVLFSMMFFIMGSAFAQKGIQSAGVHLSYGTEIESFGIGVKYQYMITDNIRLAFINIARSFSITSCFFLLIARRTISALP